MANDYFWESMAVWGENHLTDDKIKDKNAYIWNGLMYVLAEELELEVENSKKLGFPYATKEELGKSFGGKYIGIIDRAKLDIKNDEGGIRFPNIKSKVPLSFSYFLFPWDIIFGEDIEKNTYQIKVPITFTSSVFLGNLTIKPTDLIETIKFDKVTMHKNFNIQRCIFDKGIVIDDTHIYGNTLIKGASLRSTSIFHNLICTNNFNCEAANISGEFFIYNSNFRECIFDNATFNSQVLIQNSTFLKSTSFFKANFDKEVYLNYVNFHNICKFDSTEWSDRLIFRNVKFLSIPPTFFDAKIPADVHWLNVSWTNSSDFFGMVKEVFNDISRGVFGFFTQLEKPDYLAHAIVYENLSAHMEKLGRQKDQHFFFRQETRARERAMEGGFLPTIISFAYGRLWGYGHGVGRAALWWLTNILIGWWNVLSVLGAKSPTPIKNYAYDAFSHSLANAHAFLGLRRNYIKGGIPNEGDMAIIYLSDGKKLEVGLESLSALNTIGYWQSVIGVILLFFLLLTLRNRFKIG